MVSWIGTNISKEPPASNFRVKRIRTQKARFSETLRPSTKLRGVTSPEDRMRTFSRAKIGHTKRGTIVTGERFGGGDKIRKKMWPDLRQEYYSAFLRGLTEENHEECEVRIIGLRDGILTRDACFYCNVLLYHIQGLESFPRS